MISRGGTLSSSLTGTNNGPSPDCGRCPRRAVCGTSSSGSRIAIKGVRTLFRDLEKSPDPCNLLLVNILGRWRWLGSCPIPTAVTSSSLSAAAEWFVPSVLAPLGTSPRLPRKSATSAVRATLFSSEVIRAGKRAIARAHPQLTDRQVGHKFIELHYHQQIGNTPRDAGSESICNKGVRTLFHGLEKSPDPFSSSGPLFASPCGKN